MKIAVTYDNGNVFQHFGKTENFKVYEVEAEKVVSSEIIASNGTGHGALAGLLAEAGIHVLICGGIGEGAQEALDMGLVNTVVPYAQLEDETVKWCEDMLEMSPTALRFLKAAMNADTDGLAGIQQLAGDATLLYYTTDEAKEGRDAFKEKRKPDFGQFPRFP